MNWPLISNSAREIIERAIEGSAKVLLGGTGFLLPCMVSPPHSQIISALLHLAVLSTPDMPVTVLRIM